MAKKAKQPLGLVTIQRGESDDKAREIGLATWSFTADGVTAISRSRLGTVMVLRWAMQGSDAALVLRLGLRLLHQFDVQNHVRKDTRATVDG